MELVLTAVFLFLGALLLVVEVALIPGFGIIGILGICSFVTSIAYAFAVLGAIAGWVTLGIVVTLVVLFIMWAVYGKSLKRLALKKNIDSTLENPFARTLVVGAEGVAITRLALVGEAEFNGSQLEVVSADGLIDAGTQVFVSRMTESAIFVKRK